jgi:acetyl esterase/lipase
MAGYVLGGFRRLLSGMKQQRIGKHLFDTPPPPADLRISYGDDPLQFGDLRLPDGEGEGPHPVVVTIHGGFWRNRYSLEHLGFMCEAITRAGYATWSLEYRRIGDDGGGWPGTFLDVGMGVDYLRTLAPEYNLDLARVTLIGHSAGGHLVLWAAARPNIPESDPLYIPDPLRPSAVISLAGVSSLEMAYEKQLSNNVVLDLMGGPPGELPERYRTASPIEMLPLGVRTVLIHGTDDENVPYTLSEAYNDAATQEGDPVELVRLRGAGHFEVIDPQMREWSEVLKAIVKAEE